MDELSLHVPRSTITGWQHPVEDCQKADPFAFQAVEARASRREMKWYRSYAEIWGALLPVRTHVREHPVSWFILIVGAYIGFWWGFW